MLLKRDQTVIFESRAFLSFFFFFLNIVFRSRIFFCVLSFTFYPFSFFVFWNIDASVSLYRDKSVEMAMGTIIRAKVHYTNESSVFEKRLREINRIVKEN